MRKIFPACCASRTTGAPYRRAHRTIASLAIVSLTLEATWFPRYTGSCSASGAGIISKAFSRPVIMP
jgi:hypothetical protein